MPTHRTCRAKSSPWQTSKPSGGGGSSQAAAKLSEAARAAAKRAAQFTKQRQQRAYQLAQEQQAAEEAPANTAASNAYAFSRNQRSTKLQSPAETAALVATAAANAASGQYQGLKPYVEVVTDHLKHAGSSSSSSGSSGRGRGAKKAAARTLLEAHTAVFQAALDLELQQEWQEAEERLKVGWQKQHRFQRE